MDEIIRGLGIRRIVKEREPTGFGERYPARPPPSLRQGIEMGESPNTVGPFLVDADSGSATVVPRAELEARLK